MTFQKQPYKTLYLCFAQDNGVEKEPFKPQQELNRRTVSSHPAPVPRQVQRSNATPGKKKEGVSK